MKGIKMTAWIGLLLFAMLSASLAMAGGKVSGPEARSLVKEGATLLDVRTDGEFAARHIGGAEHIPVLELAARIDELGAKDEALVLYCATGNRSGRAATMLRKAGFTNVYDLGGINSWYEK